jgi:photosystem I P700 chlorophyll a apoprotein A1
MHKVKSAPAIQPRALSITQGRAVGVAHYLLVVLQQLFL